VACTPPRWSTATPPTSPAPSPSRVRHCASPTPCLGDDLELEAGQASARQAFISLLGNLRGAIGSLDRVERFLRLTGYVRAMPSYTQMPKVVDGASQLMIDIFGAPCARTAIGVSALPGGASVELDAIVQLAS